MYQRILPCLLLAALPGLAGAQNTCATATEIEGSAPFLWSGAGITSSGSPDCEGNEDEDYWFRWTATQSGDFLFDTCSNNTAQEDDTVLTIYTSCLAAAVGVCQATGDDECTGPGGTNGFLSEASLSNVCAGSTYFVRVSDWAAGGGPDADPLSSGILTVTRTSVAPPPSNDECANATSINGEGSFVWGCGSTAGGDPDCEGNEDEDVWFEWTAAQPGTYSFDTCANITDLGQEDDTALTIYRDCADAAVGACIATGDDDCAGPSGGSAFLSEASLDCVAAGDTLLIRVSDWSSGGAPDADELHTGRLTVTRTGSAGPPSNDDCENATVLASCGESVNFDTTSCTTTSGMNPGCGGATDRLDIWYAITPMTSGSMSVDTLTSPFDTRLAVWDGCNGAVVACDDDGGGSFGPSVISFDATAGTTYLIQVGGFQDDVGLGTLNVVAPAPVNDDCANALDIEGCGLFEYTTLCATTDGNPASICTFAGTDDINNDVWFRWVAPTGGDYRLETCGLVTYDSKIAVYAGAACPAFSPLACDDDACPGLQSELTFSAVGGSTYLLRIGGFASSEGSGQFRLAPISGSANYCQSGVNNAAIGILGGSSLSIAANNFNATATPVPNTLGIFYFGTGQASFAFGGGTRCVGGQTFRVQPAAFPAAGSIQIRPIDLATAPGNNITAGSCWYFQYWFRDANAPSGFDLSDGLAVTFEP